LPIIDINFILILASIVWCYALRCGYISDDHAAVAQRYDIIPDAEKVDRGESFWIKVFNDGPLMYFQTRLFWKIGFKDFPFFWHLFSYSMHLCNIYLFYLWLVPIFGAQITLAALCFWSINPMLNQNVVWVSGRPYLMAVFLSLVAMIGWQNPILFILLYLLAVITNLSIFFLPVINFIVHPFEWQSWLYLSILMLGAIPILVWKFNKRFTKGLVMDRDNFIFKLRKVNTLMRLFFYYSYSLLCPVNMGWYHAEGFRYNPAYEKFNHKTYFGCLIVAYAMTQGLAGWIFILGFLPMSNIYATNSFLQDRYLYFMSIGFSLMIAPLLAEYPFLIWMVIAFYGSRAYSYSRFMRNDEIMYRENWRNHPKSDNAINNISFFLIARRRYDEARVVIEYGLAENRTNMMLWYNLGITFAAQGHLANDEGKFRFIKAIECWKTSLEIEPRWSKPIEDMKRMVQFLMDNKILSVNKDDSNKSGIGITVPRFVGLKMPGEEKTSDAV